MAPRWNCGDRVRERDGRHVGRIVAILSSTTVRVAWDGSGWRSDLSVDDIEHAEERLAHG